MVLWHNGKFAEAIDQLEKTVAKDPSYADAHSELAAAYMFSGQHDRAIATFRRAGDLGTSPLHVGMNTAIALARSGRLAQARRLFQSIETDATSRGLWRPGVRASALLALGQDDKALDELLSDQSLFDANLLIGPQFERVHHDPRYRELVRRHGFFELAASNDDFRARLERLLGDRFDAAVRASLGAIVQ
jgi:tetratricopeptide (TPR) repeat protein